MEMIYGKKKNMKKLMKIINIKKTQSLIIIIKTD